MVDYKVSVSTGYLDDANTCSKVYIKLLGTKGNSECKQLNDNQAELSFSRGAVSHFTVSCPVSIGRLDGIELNKQHSQDPDTWFPTKVVVKSPEGDTYKFPICHWITDDVVHYFREATAPMTISATQSLFSSHSPLHDLNEREKDYRWHEPEDKIPHYMKAKELSSLPDEIQFSFTKKAEFAITAAKELFELKLKGLADSKENWTDIDDITGVFWYKRTDISDYVQQHWREDAFFGYQFLNGVNPILIRRCSALPSNFPVTDDMVSLSGQSNLADEMKKGNIFLCDYKRLDGVKPNTINGKKQYLMAPLVLFHKTPDDKLMPIAIQLKQTPADDNPIFFPTDAEYDWLMAKIFVRSADFNEHELNVHLLRTHLLAEVFAVALLRNLPSLHPLYMLLVPNTRYTLYINYLAREKLISETGVFTKFASSGGDGMFTIMERSLSSMTYSSLCMPDDIVERGMEAVPNYYYRDDGLKLWEIIHRFVHGVLSFYYESDATVKKDTAVKKWISAIFEHGFLSKADTGIPQSFTTVAELVKFVTMVIFTCSAQHAAVNNGQYDYGGWMPNTPTSLQLPPPTTKGTPISEATMLQTLPDMSTTANGMATIWLLSKQSSDFVALGEYSNDHFGEEIPDAFVNAFQGELQVLSAHIKIRNRSLEIPYTYMDPVQIENSVAI